MSHREDATGTILCVYLHACGKISLLRLCFVSRNMNFCVCEWRWRLCRLSIYTRTHTHTHTRRRFLGNRNTIKATQRIPQGCATNRNINMLRPKYSCILVLLIQVFTQLQLVSETNAVNKTYKNAFNILQCFAFKQCKNRGGEGVTSGTSLYFTEELQPCLTLFIDGALDHPSKASTSERSRG